MRWVVFTSNISRGLARNGPASSTLSHLRVICKSWLGLKHSRQGERLYDTMPPRCIFEELLTKSGQPAADIKVYTSLGAPTMYNLQTGRFSGAKRSRFFFPDGSKLVVSVSESWRLAAPKARRAQRVANQALCRYLVCHQ